MNPASKAWWSAGRSMTAASMWPKRCGKLLPHKPPDDLVQLFQAGIGHPHLPFIPIFIHPVGNLGLEAQSGANVGFQRRNVGIWRGFSTSLLLRHRTLFGLAHRELT